MSYGPSQFNRILMNLVSIAVICYVLNTLGAGIRDFRFWAVIIMVEIISYLSAANGRWQGIYMVMDMPRDQYDQYKIKWSQAQKREDLDQ